MQDPSRKVRAGLWRTALAESLLDQVRDRTHLGGQMVEVHCTNRDIAGRHPDQDGVVRAVVGNP